MRKAERSTGFRCLAFGVALVLTGCANSYMMRTPAERALWQSAEAGHPEAQRRVANQLRPDARTGAGGDPGHAAFWFQEACQQNYANAQFDFYEFANEHRIRTGDGRYLDRALACLEDAIEQGHREALVVGATRAETRERNYERAFFLYALMDGEDPDFADRRWKLVDHLSVDAPKRLGRRASEWRKSNAIKDEDDFLREQSKENRAR